MWPSVIWAALSRTLVFECERGRSMNPDAGSGSGRYWRISNPTAWLMT